MLSNHKGEALTGRLKAGDQSAFEHIYHHYREPLFHLAIRYLKDQELAEDCLQEVFIKLWNHRQQLDESLSLRGFLFTCLKRHVLNAIRTEQTRIRIATLASMEQPHAAPVTEQDVSFNESKQQVLQGMDTLSEGKRKIVHLSLLEGYSHQEIASMLHLSEHTVRSQISQACKLMRQYLTKAMSLFIMLTMLE